MMLFIEYKDDKNIISCTGSCCLKELYILIEKIEDARKMCTHCLNWNYEDVTNSLILTQPLTKFSKVFEILKSI